MKLSHHLRVQIYLGRPWIFSGWWFGTFFIFPYIGNNYPNWLIFFKGVETTNQLTFFNPPIWRIYQYWGKWVHSLRPGLRHLQWSLADGGPDPLYLSNGKCSDKSGRPFKKLHTVFIWQVDFGPWSFASFHESKDSPSLSQLVVRVEISLSCFFVSHSQSRCYLYRQHRHTYSTCNNSNNSKNNCNDNDNNSDDNSITMCRRTAWAASKTSRGNAQRCREE